MTNMLRMYEQIPHSYGKDELGENMISNQYKSIISTAVTFHTELDTANEAD